MQLKGKKTLSVKDVVERDDRRFTNKRKSVQVIRVFFEEVMKLMMQGREVRFPKKGNGRMYLAIHHTSLNGIKVMQYIKSKNLKNIFHGIVKPVFLGFDVKTGGRISDDKRFTLRFSYPRSIIAKLQDYFKDDVKRRKLIDAG